MQRHTTPTIDSRVGLCCIAVVIPSLSIWPDRGAQRARDRRALLHRSRGLQIAADDDDALADEVSELAIAPK